MDAAQALADLTEISSQIQAAVLLDDSGAVTASTFSDEDRAARVARAAQELLAAAGRVRAGSGQNLTQLEAATLGGSVFIARDGGRTIAATTTAEPTVGLVFYDLKSCLRSVAGDKPKRPAAKRKAPEKKPDAAP
jgi:predicted regulator of Ras-like GTPase activity (Roadblock/LC7/MglB family)